MKRFIVTICLLFASVTFVSAQRAAERKAQIRQGLKEEVKLTDDQITSVMAIEDEFRPKLRAIKTDAALSDDDKKAKTKAINEEKRSRIEALTGKDVARKIEAFYDSLKKKGDEQKSRESGEKEGGSGNR